MKIDVLHTLGRDSNPAIRSLFSHLVGELFQNGIYVLLGWDLERGFSLDVEANFFSYEFKRNSFCYAQFNVDGGDNSHPV